jgi:hypothetical protein
VVINKTNDRTMRQSKDAGAVSEKNVALKGVITSGRNAIDRHGTGSKTVSKSPSKDNLASIVSLPTMSELCNGSVDAKKKGPTNFNILK